MNTSELVFRLNKILLTYPIFNKRPKQLRTNGNFSFQPQVLLKSSEKWFYTFKFLFRHLSTYTVSSILLLWMNGLCYSQSSIPTTCRSHLLPPTQGLCSIILPFFSWFNDSFFPPVITSILKKRVTQSSHQPTTLSINCWHFSASLWR